MRRHRKGAPALGTAAVLCSALLAACSSGASSSGSSAGASGSVDDPVTVTFWGTYGNGGNHAQTDALKKTIIPAFEKAHPTIKINYVDVPYDSLLQKLTTSAAGGKLPDLVRADLGWVPKMGALGVFAALDEKMSDFTALAAKTYPGSLATNRFGGHHYGLPLDANTRVQIANPDALRKAGLAAPPVTFDDLRAAAPRLKAAGVQVYADSGLQGWNVYPWIWSAGGSVTDPGQTRATGYLNSPASVSGVQLLVDLYKAGEIPPLIAGDKGATATSDGLPKGSYATILDGPWMTGIWSAQYAAFKPVYAPVPAGPGGSVSVVGGEDIAMTLASRNQAAAETFIRFTQGADFQLAMARTGQMSVIPALADRETAASPQLAPFVKQLATARSRPSVPQAPQIDTVLQNELTAAFQGKETVQRALDKAAAGIDPLLTATR